MIDQGQRREHEIVVAFTVIPIAVTGVPGAVQINASYPDGSYDRAGGSSVEDAFERLAVKVGEYLAEMVDGPKQ